jgi:TolB-like protein/DNA-binding winged helix-turn-helix (wHTH) protein
LQNDFHVGDSHQVEPSLNRVTGPAGTIRLEPKVMQVLVLLAAHPGQVVAKERLMATVWPDAFVTDDVLTRAISELRRVFGDDAKEPRFIQTIPKSGYRLIARVSNGAEENGAAPGHTARKEPLQPRNDRGMPPLTKVGSAGGRGDGAPVPSWTRVVWVIGLTLVILAAVLMWRWQASGIEVSPVAIAVLPFEHLGGDPEREYLTDGLTEELSASLGQIDPEHLSVKGRTSTRMYRRTAKSPADVGRELGVQYVVEGSVRAESGRLRVTSKLIRVRDQVQIWAASFDSEPGSMLELQRELSAGIAKQVRLRLSPDRLTALARRHAESAEAYDYYLRGRHLWNQLTPETNRLAVASYLRATELDPNFALAWSGLADIYSASPINGDVAPSEVSPRAKDAIAHAVASGSDLAETQTAVGSVHYWLDWDWPAAETAYRKAISVDPSYSQAYRVLGIVLAYLGRHDEAREAMRHARELEPFAPAEQALSAHVEFAARDFRSALRFARQATVLAPEFWIGQFQLAQVYEQLGDHESTLRALEITERFGNANSKMISLRGYLLAGLGRTTEAREVLHMLETLARERYVPPYAMALVHAGLDERDAALQSLERGLHLRDANLVFLAVDPKWDSFRKDPRFLDLLDRCGFTRTARTSSHPER